MSVKPMLCSLKRECDIRNDGTMCFEQKYDGERAIIEITGGKRFIYARSGREKNRMYPDLEINVLTDCVLDGEIAATTGKFNDIQHRANRENGIKEAARFYPVKFHCFDVLSIKGRGTDSYPLAKRKAWLSSLLIPTPSCEIAPVYADGLALWNIAKTNGWEGIIGKRLDSRYGFGGRGEEWIKVKVLRQGEFWVVGYTPGTGWRGSTFGAMVLAKLEGDKFIPVGEVGTGFDQRELERLNEYLKTHELSLPFFNYVKPLTWVAPFKVRVEYLETTSAGMLRFPSYKGELK